MYIAVAVLGCALMMPVLNRALSTHPRLLRTIRMGLLVSYLLMNLYETLLFNRVPGYAEYELSLFWSYRASLALSKTNDGFHLYITDFRLFRQILLNILLYVPFGYLLPFALPRLAEKRQDKQRRALPAYPWNVVLIGIAFSLTVELLQLILKLGLFEFDDIFNNTVGCLLGIGLYHVLVRLLLKKKEPA